MPPSIAHSDGLGQAPSGDAEPLFETYRRTFVTLRADTPELLREAHHLRYQVYCVENAFEPIEANPGGLERDHYDSHAEQALLIHRASGHVAGTIRVVLPRRDTRGPSLPVHAVCKDALLHDTRRLAVTGELSRFAISKQFRRRLEDGLYGQFWGDGNGRNEWRRVIPHMSLGLISAALRIGVQQGMKYASAVMEPTLIRLLGRFGIHFKPVGPVVTYHGLRQPCYAPIEDILSQLERERRDIWEVITDGGRIFRPVEPVGADPRRADPRCSVAGA